MEAPDATPPGPLRRDRRRAGRLARPLAALGRRLRREQVCPGEHRARLGPDADPPSDAHRDAAAERHTDPRSDAITDSYTADPDSVPHPNGHPISITDTLGDAKP